MNNVGHNSTRCRTASACPAKTKATHSHIWLARLQLITGHIPHGIVLIRLYNVTKNVFRSRVALTFCHLVLITGESDRLLQHIPKILLEVQVWTLWRSKMNHCCSFSTFRWSASQPKPDQLIQPQILTLPPQACTVGTMHDGYIT